MGRRNNETLLMEIVRSLPVAMAVADYQDRTKFINEEFTSLLGFTIEDLPTVSDAWPVVYPNEHYRAYVKKKWESAVEKVRVEGGEFTPQQYRVTRKDGAMREIEFRYKPLDDYYIVMAEDVTERRRAEAALRASEERFSKAFQASPNPIAIVRRSDHKLIEVNDQWLELHGYDREEVVGRSAMELHIGLEPEVREEVFRRLARQGFLREFEVKFRVGSGKQRVGLISAEQIELGGEPCVLWLTQDITERKQVEAALRESEKRFRSLAESSQAAILLYIKDRFIYGNPAAESITGYGVEEIIGVSLWDVVHSDSHAGVKERMRARMRGEMVPSRHEIRIVTKQGEDRWVDYSIGLTELNGEQTAILTVFDITQRKQAEAALRLSEERSSQVFHESGTAMAIASLRDRRTIEANPAWLAVIGLDREAVIGRTPEEVGISFGGIRPGELIDKLAEGQAVRNVELGIHISHTGATRELVALASGVPINANGEPCILWGIQDITALKRTEAELRGSREQLRNLAARLQTIREEDLASVAREIHDELGQALTGLKLELRWLDGVLEEQPRAVRDKIASMLDLVGATIDNVRRMATALRPGILDDFGLVAALEWQAQEFAARTGVACLLVNKTENEDGLPLDRDRATAVFRIFQESLTNVARHAAATKVVASLTQMDETLILKVRDNGRGIAPSKLTNASSLGLIGMRERAQMFGGAFDIRGTPGEGTTVTVSMPLNSICPGESYDENSDC